MAAVAEATAAAWREQRKAAGIERRGGGLRGPFSNLFGGMQKGLPQACESSWDCDSPMVCCDLLVASVCLCDGGLFIPVRQGPMGQGSMVPIPIPVEPDEPNALPPPRRRQRRRAAATRATGRARTRSERSPPSRILVLVGLRAPLPATALRSAPRRVGRACVRARPPCCNNVRIRHPPFSSRSIAASQTRFQSAFAPPALAHLPPPPSRAEEGLHRHGDAALGVAVVARRAHEGLERRLGLEAHADELLVLVADAAAARAVLRRPTRRRRRRRLGVVGALGGSSTAAFHVPS